MRAAFSTIDPVYVKLSQKEYAQTQVFSNLGKELALTSGEHREFIGFLKEALERIKEDEPVEFDVRVHLPGCTAKGKGRLRNVVGLGKDVYIRLGFEVDFPKEELAKIRRYVINRQREIIQSLRFVG